MTCVGEVGVLWDRVMVLVLENSYVLLGSYIVISSAAVVVSINKIS